MIQYYDLGYAETFVFNDFLVNQIREGITVTPEHNTKLQEVIEEHFKGRSLVYISNRIFSYAVDPLTYIETSKISNLLGMAIVSTDPKNRKSAAYEGTFYKKPFEVFEYIDVAIDWAMALIKEKEM